MVSSATGSRYVAGNWPEASLFAWVAQRAALFAQVPPKARSMFTLLTGKGSQIPLPSWSRRMP